MRWLVLVMTISITVGASRPASAELRLHKRSYVAERAARVVAAFLVFQTARTVEEQQDPLGLARRRDALLLTGSRAPSLQAGALGAAMLGATVFLTAHAPDALRPLFAGPVHLGPALFEGGGMGAGVGARF